MRRTWQEHRLSAVKKKFVLRPRVCSSCGEEVTFEKMWIVPVKWVFSRTVEESSYCMKCAKNAEEVLNKVEDTIGVSLVERF